MVASAVAYPINQHSVMGYLGGDPKINHTQSGLTIASFSLATTTKWTDKQGQEQENTTWHRVVVFRESTSKFVQNYLKKGSLVFVQGTSRTREYQTEEAEKKTITEIVVSGPFSQVIMPDPGAQMLSAGRDSWHGS